MDKSYNKDTFCVAPWIGMHLSTFENVIPCCIYKQDRVFGKLKKNIPLTDHYNSPTAVEIRKQLWNGEKISECQECWYREQVATDKENPNSYRFNLWAKFKHYIDDIVANTNEDFTLKEVKFKMIDLRFDNKCNLRCRICSPDFSSALYKEAKDLGYTNFVDHGSPYNISIDESEYSVILEQLHNVDVIFFAGGEPLTQDKYYEILQYCVDNDLAKDITLWVTTNFTRIFYKNFNTVELWKHFKSVEVTASIDGSYERGEYLRKGCSWDDIVKNREYLLQEIPDLHFMICPTVNIMNCYNIVELYKEWITKGYIDRGRTHFNLLTHPAHLQFKNLPIHHKENLRSLYSDTIDWIKKRFPDNSANWDTDGFNFLISLLEKEANQEELDMFVEKTLRVDKYRGDDFFSTFTELSDLLTDYTSKNNVAVND